MQLNLRDSKSEIFNIRLKKLPSEGFSDAFVGV